MAVVTVRFFATFREASGCAESSAEAHDISSLLEALVASHGPRFKALVQDNGADSFVVLLNGRNIGRIRGLDTPLTDGDEVSLFPPVSGG